MNTKKKQNKLLPTTKKESKKETIRYVYRDFLFPKELDHDYISFDYNNIFFYIFDQLEVGLDQLEVGLGSVWGRFGVCLGSVWRWFGVGLALVWRWLGVG